MASPRLPRPPGSPTSTSVSTPAALGPDALARLLALSRALAGAHDRAEIAIAAANCARAATGASVTQVLARPAHGALALLAEAPTSGSEERAAAASGPDDLAYQGGAPVWLGSPADAAARWPGLDRGALTGGAGRASWAFLPLVVGGTTGGVLSLAFDVAQPFDDAQRRFLVEVAGVCADALSRGSHLSVARERAKKADQARVTGEGQLRRLHRQLEDRTAQYERERFGRARAEAETEIARRALEHARAPGPVRRVAEVAPLAGIHDLSVPGGRPLCGADAVAETPEPAEPVSCASCVRLVDDVARHEQRPAASERTHESED